MRNNDDSAPRNVFSRRKALSLAGAAATAAAAAAIAGCGSDGGDPGAEADETNGGAAPTPTPAPRRGGTLRMGHTSDIVFNGGYPFIAGPQTRLLDWTVVEPLVRYSKSATEPELVLAERFEYDAGRTKLTVTLKPGLTFHNGAAVTPEDVFFGIDLLRDPKKFGVTGNPGTLHRGITAYKRIDDRSMEFSFDQPRWDMTGFFAGLPVVHAASYDRVKAGQELPATGPYSFKSWTPGVSYSLARNPNWHLSNREGGPYLDGIEITNFADDEAMGMAFGAGELDMIRVNGAVAKRFRNRVKTGPGNGLMYAGMWVKNPLLADRRVRKALFLSIDRERIAKEVGEGFYPPTVQTWPYYSPAYDPSLDAAFYDPDEARRLPREAGFSQSKPLVLEFSPSGAPHAPILQHDFEQAGVRLDLVPTDAATIVQKARARQFTDLWFGGNNLSDPVPASALSGNIVYSIPNTSGYESTELAEVLGKLGRVDPAGEEAKALYARFNKLLVDDPWILPLEPAGVRDLLSDRVRGHDSWFIKPVSAPNFGRIWLSA